jgi:hypothetical protein
MMNLYENLSNEVWSNLEFYSFLHLLELEKTLLGADMGVTLGVISGSEQLGTKHSDLLKGGILFQWLQQLYLSSPLSTTKLRIPSL